ncbi:diaminopimelate decarboxylase [Candidatus Methanoliparum sp. LAM-1]|uniref:diaminopimelate decarboxylase n=1 Tax=Candidatus Methanoliparum sp. LAM-1 TaxID=2874846 RepID=UPI001E2AC20C|nr:diaminopimelate decarboxylase [Candidatus Methanoliparum sp. LAM-1]BDC35581.1 diaminopimelate decarboxylase [Candidatus Methanoliparum sp. LAM-1]
MRQNFKVKSGNLFIGNIDTMDLVDRFDTPLYVTDERIIRDKIEKFKRSFPSADIFYATKANWNISILKIMAQENLGADVFSDGELYIALLAGINREKILFNGNSKTPEELSMAIKAGVKISLDSEDELFTLSEIITDDDKVEVFFRVNPGISVNTHPKIATGLKKSKFGIPTEKIIDAYKKTLEFDNIIPVGIHSHIGSQILDISPYKETMERIMDIVGKLEKIGIDIRFIDIGGGLGIPYNTEDEKKASNPEDLSSLITPIFEDRCKEIGIKPRLILEPGRYLVGDSTILLTRVNAVKDAYKKFIAVDAGFNVLIRPAMYDAYHEMAVANNMDGKVKDKYTIVGPICESGDILGEDRWLPIVKKGDVIVIFDVGAYGFSMSSQYNGRRRPAEVLVNEDKIDLIRSRETYSDIYGNMVIPPRLL